MEKGAVGKRVRQLRDQNHWSQDELCERITANGYPVLQPNLSQMERGLRGIDADALPSFAEALGCSPCDFFEDRPANQSRRMNRLIREEFGYETEPEPPAAPYEPSLGDELGRDLLDVMRTMNPKRAQLMLGMLRLMEEAEVE
jgi:transcriptional regulator with XRE-family HTH domain